MTRFKRYRRTLRGRYTRHKANAKRRGVPFLLTYGQWLIIWKLSGKLAGRGPRMRQWVMCRVDDVGAYEWGNVYIGRAKHNLVDTNRTRVVRRHTARSTTVTYVSA
jgi:hypothetical protein